jgi:hypothetical protein
MREQPTKKAREASDRNNRKSKQTMREQPAENA